MAFEPHGASPSPPCAEGFRGPRRNGWTGSRSTDLSSGDELALLRLPSELAAKIRYVMLELTGAEEAQIGRATQVQSLRTSLRSLSNADFRRRVDALPPDDEELTAIRKEAAELATSLGRDAELSQAWRVAEIGADEAGEQPLRFNLIRSEADYRRINDADFYRSMRLGERARDHALAITVGDRLPRAAQEILLLPQWFLEFSD